MLSASIQGRDTDSASLRRGQWTEVGSWEFSTHPKTDTHHLPHHRGGNSRQSPGDLKTTYLFSRLLFWPRPPEEIRHFKTMPNNTHLLADSCGWMRLKPTWISFLICKRRAILLRSPGYFEDCILGRTQNTVYMQCMESYRLSLSHHCHMIFCTLQIFAFAWFVNFHSSLCEFNS